MSADTPLEEIEPNDKLYRRLHHSHVYEDGTVKRIAYEVNGKPDDQASVDLAHLTTPKESAERGKPGTGVGQILASVPISLGFQVIHKPVKEDLSKGIKENPAHCQIEGQNTRDLCKKLAEATKPILIQPRIIPSPE